tara:strand:- start:193 stop:642 length:450 start_codon:yes stop_codon:yes gene_type:complete
MVKTSKSKNKSNRNSSTATTINKNWIKDLINSTFDDNCAYDASGSRIRGPGLLCGTWIVLLVLGTLLNIVWSWKLVDGINLTWSDIIIQNIIDIVITTFVVTLAYNMCNICRGFVGFLVVWVILTIISSVRWFFFSSYRSALMAINMEN